MQKNYLLILLTAVLLSSFSAASHCENDQWTYSTGFDYSSGDYGDDPVDTDITYIPLSTSYRTGNWKLKATLPWVEINGPGTVIGAGDGGVITDTGPGQISTESGIGDIWLSATYNTDLIPADLIYLDLGVKVKLATADEDKGLGTGEMDYSLQADIFKPIGNMMPFATLAYKMKGSPDGLQLDDVIYLSLGNDFEVSEKVHVGLSLDYQESSTSTGDDSLEVMSYFNRKLSRKWSLMFYAYKGLDDGSPDYGLGLQISHRP